MKKYIFSTILIVASCVVLSSCENWLEEEPENKVNAGTYFSTSTQCELFTRGLLESYLPADTEIAIDYNTDLSARKTPDTFYEIGVFNAGTQSAWSWTQLRRVNYMIKGLEKNGKNISEKLYNHYMGTARFWRARLYDTRIDTFGDVPWCEEVPEANADYLFAEQNDREEVMHHVLEDLNFASENCLAEKEYVTSGCETVNKWVALAMKARICLYEASYRKYHKVNPSTNIPWNNKFETSNDLYKEAINACKEIIDHGPYKLHTGDVKKAYSELFLSEAFCTDEVIWGHEYSEAANHMHDITFRYNSATYDQMLSPTKPLVNMYLKLDGTPITNEGKIEPDKEFEGRDWRMAQSIQSPDHKMVDGSPKSIDASITRTGYQYCKWNIEKAINYSKSYSNNSLPILRYGEVLLMYAEAMAETNQMTKDVWDMTIGALRERAGVKNIYPESGEYQEDPYLKNYYKESPLPLSNTIIEIRRERAVELVMENKSRARDIKRWCVGQLIAEKDNANVGWSGIYVTPEMFANGFDFAGTHFTFATTGTASSKIFLVPNSGSNLTWALYENGQMQADHGYLTYCYKIAWEERMYIHPISTTDINLNPQLRQNWGWN